MDLRESVQCPGCGAWGNSGEMCPNNLCGYVHGKSLGQHLQKGINDTSEEIGSAVYKMADGTTKAVGDVAGVIGGGIATDAHAGVAVGAAGVLAAFSIGGFWMGMSTILGGYVGLVSTPSVLSMLIHSKLLILCCSAFFGLLVGGLGGLLIAFQVGLALRKREKSCVWLFVPLAVSAAVLTMRIPDALSVWWDATPWW